MNGAGATMRGRPLTMLAVLMLGWVAIRATSWESPFSAATPFLDGQSASEALPTISGNGVPKRFVDNWALQDLPAARPAFVEHEPGSAAAPLIERQDGSASEFAENLDIAAGHQLLWMAAMAHLPVPRELERQMVRAPLPNQAQPSALSRKDRWSLDAWAFWREGSGISSSAQGRLPSYGASQAAAVLQYRLAPQDRRDPRAHVRIYRALVDDGESEIAPGISSRILPALHLRAHAELRVTDRGADAQLRPAAFVTTELPPIALPARLRAEAYAQAGYVGGNGATAFADGQVHILRDLESFDLGRVSIGGAAWGGAQEGANRLDIGPSLRLDLKLEHAPARLSVDYRERVAGNARPQSGVAVTVSSSF